MAKQSTKRKGYSAPREVIDLYKKLKLEKQQARDYFKQLRSQGGGAIQKYRVVTWLSNNSHSLIAEQQHARLEVAS